MPDVTRPSPAPPQLPDRFSLVRKLGQGGMGVVYEVIDRERQARVALKTLLNLQPTALFRFKNEFRTLAGLSHEHLIPLYELISDGQTWFFTMELVDGVDFLTAVRTSVATDAPPLRTTLAADDETVTSWGTSPAIPERTPAPAPGLVCDEARLRDGLRQLAIGVKALHDASILHRDIKPSNVIVRPDGRLQLLDFGLAKKRPPYEPRVTPPLFGRSDQGRP